MIFFLIIKLQIKLTIFTGWPICGFKFVIFQAFDFNGVCCYVMCKLQIDQWYKSLYTVKKFFSSLIYKLFKINGVSHNLCQVMVCIQVRHYCCTLPFSFLFQSEDYLWSFIEINIWARYILLIGTIVILKENIFVKFIICSFLVHHTNITPNVLKLNAH